MDKPFKYAIYIYTLEVGNLNKIYKNENEISIKICFSTFEELPKLERMVFCTDQCRKANNSKHGART